MSFAKRGGRRQQMQKEAKRMSPKNWEESMVDAYWDYRWRQIMDPLCDTFQRWKAGDPLPPQR